MKALKFIFSSLLIVMLIACQETHTTTKDVTGEASAPEAEFNVMFYNVENLFDLEDDPQKADEEFTPLGEKRWDEQRYQTKLVHLSKVISSAGAELPDVIGLCEVENRKVVEDLANTGKLKGKPYEIIHRESPDGRGIDVALLYNPERIKLREAGVIETTLPVGDRPNTRLILHASGKINKRNVHFFVNHWPSRYGGKEKSEPNRMAVAQNLRNYLDQLIADDPDAEIVLMGDFNDYPVEPSITDVLGAEPLSKQGSLVNLMDEMHRKGLGSYNYRGEWGALDQFMVSSTLMDGKGLDVKPESAQFIRHDWMMYVNDQGEAYPSRTYGGANYYGGYSDHLPILAEFLIYP